MPKGQERGHKEAKKPKKKPAPRPIPAQSAVTTHAPPRVERWSKK